MRTMKWLALGSVVLLGTSACKKAPEAQTTAEPASKPAAAAPAEAKAAELKVGELVAEKGGIKISKLAGSPAFPEAKLSLRNPADGAKGVFDFEVTGYELGKQTVEGPFLAASDKGQHIHFIVDNGPYSAHYEPKVEKQLEPGTHVVLAFLSRSYHESVKHDFVLTRVQVGDKKDPALTKVSLEKDPHLFYSRPKGTYSGAGAKKLLLDFFPVNAELSKTGYKVEASLGGQTFELTEWVPYVVEGLAMGEQTVTLRLLDKDGKQVAGPFGKVERTVTLSES